MKKFGDRQHILDALMMKASAMEVPVVEEEEIFFFLHNKAEE